MPIIKSAYSNNIKERRDISTAMFDPEGNMIAQAEHVPMHLGSLLGIIGEVFKKFAVSDIKTWRYVRWQRSLQWRRDSPQ